MSAHGRPTAGHQERPRGYPSENVPDIPDTAALQAAASQYPPGSLEYWQALGLGANRPNPWLPGKVTAWICMFAVFGIILPCFS